MKLLRMNGLNIKGDQTSFLTRPASSVIFSVYFNDAAFPGNTTPFNDGHSIRHTLITNDRIVYQHPQSMGVAGHSRRTSPCCY